MARKTTSRPKAKTPPSPRGFRPLRWLLRMVAVTVTVVVLVILAHGFITPPRSLYMNAEARRLGGIDYVWVDIEQIAPVMLASVVAAEDANFCNHWGFDMVAIRAALDEGANRGASTLSQQVVKNVYLWHGRNWARKALEGLMTPVVEALWSKRRILEVYLNMAEFDEGVFGVEAAAQHYFGTSPAQLTATQAARLAAVLPAPKSRSASKPSASVLRRAAQIADGAATIRADGRTACFED